MFFIFCFYTFFYFILENMSTNVRNFRFLVIFDTCDVVYIWSISLLPPIVLDNLFGSVYHEYIRQAGLNCSILEKLGLFVYVFLKTSFFFQCFLCLLSYFLFTVQGGNIYLSLRSFSIDVYSGKMPTYYMI